MPVSRYNLEQMSWALNIYLALIINYAISINIINNLLLDFCTVMMCLCFAFLFVFFDALTSFLFPFYNS